MVIMTVFIVTCIWTRRLIISCAFNLYYFCSYVCVLVCMSSPLGWCRTPRARTRCQCYISPSETEWMRTAPPTGCNIAWSRLRRFPSGRIWSRRWPQKRCRPNCPGRGRTAPLVAWRSWCDEPVYHQHHLKRKDADHYIQYMFMWTFIMEHNNIQSAKEFFFYKHDFNLHSAKAAAAHTHTHITGHSLWKTATFFLPTTGLTVPATELLDFTHFIHTWKCSANTSSYETPYGNWLYFNGSRENGQQAFKTDSSPVHRVHVHTRTNTQTEKEFDNKINQIYWLPGEKKLRASALLSNFGTLSDLNKNKRSDCPALSGTSVRIPMSLDGLVNICEAMR